MFYFCVRGEDFRLSYRKTRIFLPFLSGKEVNSLFYLKQSNLSLSSCVSDCPKRTVTICCRGKEFSPRGEYISLISGNFSSIIPQEQSFISLSWKKNRICIFYVRKILFLNFLCEKEFRVLCRKKRFFKSNYSLKTNL